MIIAVGFNRNGTGFHNRTSTTSSIIFAIMIIRKQSRLYARWQRELDLNTAAKLRARFGITCGSSSNLIRPSNCRAESHQFIMVELSVRSETAAHIDAEWLDLANGFSDIRRIKAAGEPDRN